MIENRDLLLDLVEWVGQGPKPYADVMAAWRTSCPRLQIWEDAVDHGFLARHHVEPGGSIVKVTDKGMQFLRTNGRA